MKKGSSVGFLPGLQASGWRVAGRLMWLRQVPNQLRKESPGFLCPCTWFSGAGGVARGQMESDLPTATFPLGIARDRVSFTL